MARDDQGKIYTWGKNDYDKELGNGTDKNSNVPICISDIENSELAGRNIVDIKCYGYNAKIVRDENGKLYTWGRYTLAGGTDNITYIPVCISDIDGNIFKGKNIVEINEVGDATIAKDNNGKLYTWGYNGYGMLGNGTSESSDQPICISDTAGSVLNEKNIIEIGGLNTSVLVKDNNGKLYAWGCNRNGELLNGTTDIQNSPVCITEIPGSVLYQKRVDKILEGDYKTQQGQYIVYIVYITDDNAYVYSYIQMPE